MSRRDRERRCPQRFPQTTILRRLYSKTCLVRPSSRSAYREMRDSTLAVLYLRLATEFR